jgi:hypothetical protein
MNVRKPEDVLLIIAFGLIAIGLILVIGGWVWGLNTLSQIGGAPTPHGYVQTGIGIALMGTFIGTPILIIGFLTLVVSVIIHFATKRKGHTAAG